MGGENDQNYMGSTQFRAWCLCLSLQFRDDGRLGTLEYWLFADMGQ